MGRGRIMLHISAQELTLLMDLLSKYRSLPKLEKQPFERNKVDRLYKKLEEFDEDRKFDKRQYCKDF